MTPTVTPEMRAALAEVTDSAERAYLLLRWKHLPSSGRAWWSRMDAQERAPWRIAAEARAEALREAIAVAEGVRDADRRDEDAAKGRLAELHAREQAEDLPLTASLVSGPEYYLMHHRSAAYGAQAVADALRALAGDGGER